MLGSCHHSRNLLDFLCPAVCCEALPVAWRRSPLLVLLIRWSITDIYQSIALIVLPTNPDPQALNCLTIHPYDEAVSSRCYHTLQNHFTATSGSSSPAVCPSYAFQWTLANSKISVLGGLMFIQSNTIVQGQLKSMFPCKLQFLPSLLV